MQLGYRCYLKVTERTQMQTLLKNEIKRLTKRGKCDTRMKKSVNIRKRCLAKIYSKLENLFPDDT